MKIAAFLLCALVLVSVESSLLHVFGLSRLRADVGLIMIVFLALRASTVEGAIGAFAIGYFVDISSGAPTSLFPFLAMLVFLGARMGAGLVDTRGSASFAALCLGVDLAHSVLAFFMQWITAPKGLGPSGRAFWMFVPQAALTAAVALLLLPLLKGVEGFFVRREERGLLR